jgi:hypothetical protein
VIVGLVWGFLALQGAIGLVGFAAINAGLVIVKLLIIIVDLFTLISSYISFVRLKGLQYNRGRLIRSLFSSFDLKSS